MRGGYACLGGEDARVGGGEGLVLVELIEEIPPGAEFHNEDQVGHVAIIHAALADLDKTYSVVLTSLLKTRGGDTEVRLVLPRGASTGVGVL